MYKAADMALWQGRVDDQEASPARRWHQQVQPWERQHAAGPGTALVGFACDEGVRRNRGRTGAHQGPAAIRRALANLAWHGATLCVDSGDISCDDHALEAAQSELARHLTVLLQQDWFPVVLGGGHEVAWGSFQGLAATVAAGSGAAPAIGIINFDAHFDLRNPEPLSGSGTPFRQIAQWCERRAAPFNYMVLGLNPAANTRALFDVARAQQVHWRNDIDCHSGAGAAVQRELQQFIAPLDYLYVSVCLDVFAACHAPGVSAPAALGVEPRWVVQTIGTLKKLCREHRVRWLLADIAEYNPRFDIDTRTAQLAARLVHEITAGD